MIVPPVPWIDVKTILRSLSLHHRAIENERLQPLHVSRVVLLAEDDQLAALGRRHGLERLGLDGIHPLDDAARVRLHHLRAVAEVHLVAVVVRRIVARGDDDARVRALVAHRKGKLRRRARRGEEADIAPEIHRDLGGELRELPREMARVVRDRDLRLHLRRPGSRASPSGKARAPAWRARCCNSSSRSSRCRGTRGGRAAAARRPRRWSRSCRWSARAARRCRRRAS